ncbi:hypothetical protein LR004_03125, partial [Candidatus Gracilibacteria bacterium]|nr:hypothetical protein [Candidatus Gracilibacteria bacterium]
MDYKIKKLGGENAAQLSKSAKNILHDYTDGNNQVVVVSAMRSPDFNTTDKLILIGKLLQNEKVDVNQVEGLINQLVQFHLDTLEEKILCSKESLIDLVEKIFVQFRENILYFIENSGDKTIPTDSNDYCIETNSGEPFSILGFGEAISCRVFSLVIDTVSLDGVISKSVDLSNIIKQGDLDGKDEKAIFNHLSVLLSGIIEEKIVGGYIPVLSGYMGSFSEGIEATIGRGYSDATAAICTVGLAQKGHGVILEIQKSVKGLLSADPRILDSSDDAILIPELDYLTAREITGDCGAQAKLLHHQTLRSEVQEAGVKIHLFDPFSGEEGSWIVNKNRNEMKGEKCSGVSFIGGRENVIFFSISSGKMFENGILSRLFEIVKNYYGVDIVSASESEISFTIDGNQVAEKSLEKMTQEIKKEFGMGENNSMEFVEYRTNKSLIFCVGQHMENYVGLLARSTKILGENNINIEIASQGRLQRAMIFGIEQKDMKKAVN